MRMRGFLLVAARAWSTAVPAQGVVNALCSPDQAWYELAAQEFTRATGIRVLQTRKPTGEAFAQSRAEAANPKTDIGWGAGAQRRQGRGGHRRQLHLARNRDAARRYYDWLMSPAGPRAQAAGGALGARGGVSAPMRPLSQLM